MSMPMSGGSAASPNGAATPTGANGSALNAANASAPVVAPASDGKCRADKPEFYTYGIDPNTDAVTGKKYYSGRETNEAGTHVKFLSKEDPTTHAWVSYATERALAAAVATAFNDQKAAAEAGDDGAEQPKKKMKKMGKESLAGATAASDSSDGDEESDDESDDGPKASKQRANAASVRAPHLASRVSYISKIEKTRRKCRRRSSSKRMRRVSRSKVRPSDGPKWQHDSRGRYFLTGIRKEKRMRAVQKPMRAMKQKPMRPPRSSVVKAN